MNSNGILILSFMLLQQKQILSTNDENYSSNKGPTPLVIWPGMGDSCHNDFSIGSLTKYFEYRLPGLYVHCVSIGDSWLSTSTNSFVSNVDDKIATACAFIEEDPKLRRGYNAIGFSQGSQFLRGVAQRCPSPPMRTLISVGGQHRGVYGLPVCGAMTHLSDIAYVICDFVRYFISFLARLPVIRSYSVQAQYWRDPYVEEDGRRNSDFLADLNQEVSFNSSYKENLQKLENLVLIRFLDDEMVVPSESQWFGFYRRGQAVDVETLRESRLYVDDLLGLQKMDADGKLRFIAVAGGHLQLGKSDIDGLVEDYLKK